MISQGLLREQEFEEEFKRLYERMNILGNQWINASLLNDHYGSSVVKHFHQLLFEVIYPYLTNKGKTLYNDLI